jgi:hypothetical protein
MCVVEPWHIHHIHSLVFDIYTVEFNTLCI